MTKKVTKYGIMIITVAMLTAIAIVGAGAAAGHVYNINNADEWKEFVKSDKSGIDEYDIINLTGDIDFGGSGTDVSLNIYGEYYSGDVGPSFEGNGHVISNFNISSGDAIYGNLGLFGNYGGLRVSNLTIRNFSVGKIGSGGNFGGVVGYSDGVSYFENVCIEHGTIIGGNGESNAGLLGGSVDYFVGSNVIVRNCTINLDGTDVGGIVGISMIFNAKNCSVENCSLVCNGQTGGLTAFARGYYDYDDGYAECAIGCNVTNCVIVSGNYSGGGLISNLYANDFGTPEGTNIFSDCHVVNCSIVSLGLETEFGYFDYCGGLIGGLDDEDMTLNVTDTSVDGCSILSGREGNDNIGIVIGYGNIDGCTVDLNSNFIFNATYDDEIKLYDGNGEEITELYSLFGSYLHTIFNTTGHNSSKFSGNTIQVTYLGTYGVGGTYGYGSAPTVIYDGNGHTGGSVPGSQTVAFGETVVIADKGNMVKEGYGFNGWYNESTGLLRPESKLTVKDHLVTLYANWSNVTPLLFNPSNGSSMTYTGEVCYGDDKITFIEPKYEDHIFNGWNVLAPADEGGILVANKSGNLVKDVSSYTDESGKWIRTTDYGRQATLFANWSDVVSPECDLPYVVIENSYGEIKEVGDSYTVYVRIQATEYERSLENWSLGSFQVKFSLEGNVSISDIAKGIDVPDDWTVTVNEEQLIINAFNSTSGGSYVPLDGRFVSIVNFTLDPTDAEDGAEVSISDLEVNLLNTSNNMMYKVSDSYSDFYLSDSHANSVIANSSYVFEDVCVEDKTAIPDAAFIVFNDFAQVIPVEEYSDLESFVELGVDSVNNHIVYVYDYDYDQSEEIPYIIAVNGSSSTGNYVTADIVVSDGYYDENETWVDLSYVADHAEKEYSNIKKNNGLTGDAVSYEGSHSYVYTGLSVEEEIIADLKINKHNAYSRRYVGDRYGYDRNFTTENLTLTFYNASSSETDPIVPGTYTFNITMNDDVWDYEEQTFSDKSYTFTIVGNWVLEGKWMTDAANFSAVNKSTGYMMYTYPNEGISREWAVFGDSTVRKFNFTTGNKKEVYLPLNVAMTKIGTNLTALKDYFYDEPALTFAVNTHPAPENENPVPTVFYFTGCYLGDVNMDGAVNMEDPLFIAQRLSTNAFNDGNRLYGMVVSSGANPKIDDATAIAGYKAELYDEHYKEKQSA